MDINDLRSLMTVVVFGVFLGIVWWAYSPRRKSTLERVGRSVLED